MITTKLKNGLRNPKSAILELRNKYHRQIRSNPGVKIMEKDWDNLIILDACRYDIFEEENTLPGRLESVVSMGSNTGEFLMNNFAGGEYADTIYISANPQVYRHRIDENFFKQYRLWEDKWDSEHKTVLPKAVVDSAIRAEENYPDKKLIIHFIQPHYPFIGAKGRNIEHGTITGDGVISDEREKKTVWELLEEGRLEKEEVWDAYVENLQLALQEVDRLLDSITGKSVVTSDHGNAFGEWGVYGHSGWKYLSSLVKVPWLTIESDVRKTIRQGKVERSLDDSPSTKEKLGDLGYLEG